MAAAALLTCATARCASAPGEVEIVSAGGARAASPRGERYARDVTEIAGTFEAALQLPRVEVPVVLFPDRRAFEQGLLQIGYTPQLARTASGFDGIGGASAVLINAQVVDGYERRRRVRLLAHELVHSMQYRFGGGRRGESEQWLREGFAEWVACRVTAHLRLAHFEELREEVLAPLATVPVGGLPTPLERLSTFPQWAEAQRRSTGQLYAQAFLATEILMDRHGASRLVHYFEQFATITDRHQAFHSAFGMTLPEFERVLATRWHQAVMQRR